MKKLVISAIAIMMAVVAHSAAVSWKSTTMKDINGDSIGKSSDYTATCQLYTFDSVSGDYTAVLSPSVATSSTASTMKGTIDGAANSTTYYAQLVVTDKAGNSITSEMAQFSTDANAEYTINFTTGAGFATESAKINYAGGWTAAPEPTSGLLLLMGLAGLALKRKHA